MVGSVTQVSLPPKGGTDDIQGALLTLRRTTGLPVTFGGLVPAGQPLRLTELIGTRTGALRGLAVRTGNGVGGKSIVLARPVTVTDYAAARTISHQYDAAVTAEGLRAVLAVPVVVRHVVRAVLYGAVRQAVPLGDRIVTAAVEVARELEQDLAVRDAAWDEARRLLTSLDRPADRPTGGRWEEVRQAYAELRALAQHAGDATLRTRLHDIAGRLAAASLPPEGPARPPLSPRELDVLACVAVGCTNATAADQLGLRPETVKSYLRSAMRKVGAHSRLEAVVAARRAGILP
jgi:LuxR family transcriptional regulator, regulator of acetate metabolism